MVSGLAAVGTAYIVGVCWVVVFFFHGDIAALIVHDLGNSARQRAYVLRETCVNSGSTHNVKLN